ncbi:MAG: NAD(P)-dependent oxidoreductase [Bryobacteraceae bacterium]
MRVLITGHRGYIGSVLTRRLLERGFEVTGIDAGFFDECVLPGARRASPGRDLTGDIRDLAWRDISGHDAVVHLAALSNDPIGNLNETWTADINLRASVRLAELARESRVPRFLFSSSCIMYGAAAVEGLVNEQSPLDPKTEYARSKVAAERELSRLAGSGFSPVFLRNGTIYGYSPAMRFDTVINSLVGSALATGRVTIHSDGEPWRPVVHVSDVAAAFETALTAPIELLHNQAINTGAAACNCQVKEMARVVAGQVPGCTVECLRQAGADQRTYRTDFEKIGRLLAGWAPRIGLEEGVAGLVRDLGPMPRALFEDPRFTRLAWLRKRLDEGSLDGALRGTEVVA